MFQSVSNPNPVVHQPAAKQNVDPSRNAAIREAVGVDCEDVFDILGSIKDPEHPYTLGQLNVIKEELIDITPANTQESRDYHTMRVEFTPTVPHCNLTTTIGLCLREKLKQYLPEHHKWKVDINVTPGSHQDEKNVNKQINDKERVAAAMDNPHLVLLVKDCIREPE